MNCKLKLCISLFFMIALFMGHCLGDGAVISGNYNDHVFIPSQKAVIDWDGTNETLIISTRIANQNLSNLAWVIPIPSNVPPMVTRGDISIFYDLAEAFFPSLLTEEYNHWRNYYESKGVQVIENKTVSFYDITILKATNATLLVNWLNNNSYPVSLDTIPLLQHYCSKENYWFVANKINISHLVVNQTILNEIEKIVEVLNQTTNEYLKINSSIGDYYLYNDLVIYEFLWQLEDALPDMNGDNNYLSDIVECMGTNIDIYDNITLIPLCFSEFEIDLNETEQYNILREYQDVCKYIIENVYVTTNFENNSSKLIIRKYALMQDIVDIINLLERRTESDCFGDVFNQSIIEFPDYLNRITLYNDISEIKNKCLSEREEKYHSDLVEGVATPLKIIFQPDYPFYPMKISSLNQGYSNISVYIFSEEPMKDENDILLLYELTNNLSQIEDESVGNHTFVSWLKYSGDLKELSEDSVFIPTEYNASIDPNSMQYKLLKNDDETDAVDETTPGFEVLTICSALIVFYYVKRKKWL